MSRFRSVLLAMGVVTLMASGGAAFLNNHSIEQGDENRRLAAAERVSALNDYFERARVVTLTASNESAFTDFYSAPGTREERIARGGRLMERVNNAVKFVGERVYPRSIGEACFIDRTGAENARVVRGEIARPHELSKDEAQAPYFYPTFAIPIGEVYQSAPYESPDTGEWVISQATKIDTGRVISPAILHFEITIESFHDVLKGKSSTEEVRVVDTRTGVVVINSRFPQRIGAQLGTPGDLSYGWVKTAKNGTTLSSGGMRHAMRLVAREQGNDNHWAVVVSTPERKTLRAQLTSRGAVSGGLLLGILCLALSVLGYVRHGRDMDRAARRDDLTLLPNRLAFRERLSDLLREGRSCAVLLLDLNRFKEINDTLGHQAGDDLLCEVAQRLQRALRGNSEAAARLGGDEFVVVAPGVTTTEDALRLAERIERQLEHPLGIRGVPIRLSASIGVALIPVHANEYGAALRCADVAMYAAKESHDGPVVYDIGLDMHSPQRLGLDAQLAQAIANDELEIFYQPIYDLAQRKVTRVEALVRWRHPKLGLLQPSEFIPRAEETGFIRVITRTVLWKSLDHLAEWRMSGLDVSLNVNVSAAELSDEFFASEVQALLVAQSVPPQSLTLELTESALLVDSERSADNLRAFSAMGVGLAIDDFGTGYSSLAQLRMCPATQLKIDGSLVANMVNNPVDALIVRSTIELGEDLGLVVIAEGVEDEATLHTLQAMGCNEVQGFVFAAAEAFGSVEWLPADAGETVATL